MALNQDFRDLFAELNGTGAEYLLVGGYALAVHAVPRFTKDLDVWVHPSPENAGRVMRSLVKFGAPLGELTERDLATAGIVFQIGIPPNRIDVLTSIDGVEFAEAWADRVTTKYGDQKVPVISRRCLIANKRASGRAQDLVDVDLLETPQQER